MLVGLERRRRAAVVLLEPYSAQHGRLGHIAERSDLRLSHAEALAHERINVISWLAIGVSRRGTGSCDRAI
ncbi:hypothetical protein QTI66_00090 [Variovorax sp. J22R133]|uniref:hypothetical protein n=1 Tax=Variovorax brevis TaxID=3053503 RepID=UPI002575A2AB|nr:hypothetical protein [Variovorax sp. J22R133]MDM0110528.1 hypothetical protein [Variovorax sp. J22R133]